MHTEEDCLFCRIVAGTVPSTKVFENSTTYAFKDIHPQAKVHVLVVPKKHYADVHELAESDPAELADIISVAQHIADEEYHGHFIWSSTPAKTQGKAYSMSMHTCLPGKN